MSSDDPEADRLPVPCDNGHEIPSGALFCPRCGSPRPAPSREMRTGEQVHRARPSGSPDQAGRAPLETREVSGGSEEPGAIAGPPKRAVSPPGRGWHRVRTHWRDRPLLVLLGGAVLLVLVAGVGVAAVLASDNRFTDPGHPSTVEADRPSAPTPSSPEERCENVVASYLRQVPEALSEGYNGVDSSPLLTQYGAESRVFLGFEQAEGVLIGKIDENGDPNKQVIEVLPMVHDACYNVNGSFDSAPDQGLSGLN